MKNSNKLTFDEIVNDALIMVAKKMLIAAKTAPKARGIDNTESFIVGTEGIERIAKKMTMMGNRDEQAFFIRDAGCIRKAPVMVLIGTKINSIGLKKCGLCGFKNCDEKNKYPEKPCAFNTGDLGIAIGSAVSVAAHNHVDNRIMFSAGMAAKELSIMSDDVKIIYGIPLSASGKNPFFDRG